MNLFSGLSGSRNSVDGFERIWMEAFLRPPGYWPAAFDKTIKIF